MIQTSKRINWIDWAKTLGIFLVVVGHIYFPSDLLYYKKLIYGFHMPFFFLVSAYLDKQEGNFFKKNFQRIIIPYLSLNALVFCTTDLPYFFLGYWDGISLFKSIFRTLFGLTFTISWPTWFLITLFVSKMITHYLLKLPVVIACILSVVISISGYQLYALVGDQFPIFVRVPFFFCQGMMATPMIVLGYYLKKYDLINLVFSKKKLVIGSCLILLPIYIYGINKISLIELHICDWSTTPFYGVVLSVIGCYLFIMFCRSLNDYSSKFVQRISMGTIIILGIHLDIYRTFVKIYLQYFDLNIVVSLLECCLMMILSYFIIGFVQKNKTLSFLFLGKMPLKV